MLRFLMWIASFFILVIFTFWRYMGFAWFTWKNKDFFQVQSKHFKRLHNVIPSFEKCLNDLEASSKMKVLNKNQCVHLFHKLVLAMKGIDKMLSTASEDLNFQLICEELCYLQKKVDIVRKNCIEEEEWCHSAIFQFQNKETFRELLLDLKYCYNSAKDMYLFHHPNQSNNILSIQFDAATYEQVLEDGCELKKKLELVLQGEILGDCEIAQHLLLKFKYLNRVDSGGLNALEVQTNFKVPKLIQKIGEGGYGDVYKSNWLGIACATKVLKGDLECCMNFQKEVENLKIMSHPNLIPYFDYGITKKVDENLKDDEILEDDEIGEMHLVMELMDSNLSMMLKNIKRPLPYQVAIDIMYQIAKGICYLHDMQVAHLDLKPDNVLCSSIPIEDMDPYCIFKVINYGTSQLEVRRNLEHPKSSQHTTGTLDYMAPEMIEGSKTLRYPFQADVWSFAMICLEILFGKVPYFDLNPKAIYDQLKDPYGPSLRRALLNDCEELSTLIQECWFEDPLQRPSFSNICDRLTNLKKSFLKGESCTLKASKSIINHVPKVDEGIAIQKEILIDLDHQLCKAKRLLKMNYVGIVGMGGIGKTTLAKAIFDDVTVNSSYHASYFVAECKNYKSSYEILCEVLCKLGNDCKPKNFGDAQEMMKELLIGKKVLLILDDVNEEALVYDIVPPNIVRGSKGTTIIITTRNWSTIESFVGIHGRLDVELLDEKAATTLFTSHLCWGVASMSLDFVALCKHIVQACNGLPLSLKVMGAFLRTKKRLRSWEQALQKMARGKNLDGDEKIWNTLQISYDGLNDGIGKKMFLDMACFFCRDVYPFGISKEMILSIWSKDGIIPVGELEKLINLSLLKVNEDGDILEMHDQLRDMGRMIAKNTRIWKASMIPESGFSNKDVEVLEGISLQGTNNHVPFIKHDSSLDFAKLRVLILESFLENSEVFVANLDFLFEIASQSSQLEVIIIGNPQNLIGFSYTLPTNIASILNTKVLDLCGRCTSLKILDLRGLKFLKQFPKEFASRKTLLKLNVNFCSSLVALPKEVGNLSSLITLNLKGCSCLVVLPKEIENLSSLTTLVLSGCSSLVALPKQIENLSSLITLDLNGCSRLMTLPKEVGYLSSLTTLNLWGCSSLVTLPKEVGNLSFLTTFILWSCSSLATLPKDVGYMSSLTSLDFWGCSNLTTLPKEVGNLSSLTTLILRGCYSLIALPKEVGNLSSLTTLDLSECSSLVALPKEVGNLSSLTILNLRGCSNLAALPKEVGDLSSLITLDLSECLYLISLPKEVENLSSLTTLDLNGCLYLDSLLEEVGNLSSLTTLDLSGCSNLIALPKEVGNLVCLTIFNLEECSNLVALPMEVGNLSSLTSLYLSFCSSLTTLPNEVGNLSSLTTLDLSGCLNLVSLPNEVGKLTSLTTLRLEDCSSLVTLPREVGNLSSLTTLHLEKCSNLVALPKELGNLSSLIALNLEDCSNLEILPKEMGKLSSLIILDLTRCFSLEALPKEVENLSFLTTLNLCGHSNLTTLPKEIGNLSSLITLSLWGCSGLVVLPKEVGNLSSLTSLDLKECLSLVALPKEIENLSSLIDLNIEDCSSLATLPKEIGNLSSLKTLNLLRCSSMVTLPKEVGNLSSLTTLYFKRCSSLMALPKEVGNLSSLTFLAIISCSNLTTLPKEIEDLSSLVTLDLSGCSKMVALPNEVGILTSLTTLKLWGCSIMELLPQEVGNLFSLTTLDLSGCSSLVALPKEIENLYSLTTLNLTDCSSLVIVPNEVGNLSSLTTLNLWECSKLVALPIEVGNLFSLTTLMLRGCTSLVALPLQVGNLSLLTTIDLGRCLSLVALPKEVGNLSSLTSFSLCGCLSLVALPKEVGNLSSLTTLDLKECSSLMSLPMEVKNLSSLTYLVLKECLSLKALPKEVGNLSSLISLNLEDCSGLINLPKEVGNLSSLTTLNLSRCSSLTALPKEVGELSSLTSLNLWGCSSLAMLPDEVGNLFSLTTLNLWRCSNLAVLPKKVGNLSSLTTLNLSKCSSLVVLPKEVGNLSSLTTLDLSGCSSLVALPKEVGNLSSLITLDLSGCSSLVALPKEVEDLSSFATLNLTGCSSLVVLPKEVEISTSLTTLDLDECSSLVSLPQKVESFSSLTTFNLDGCSNLDALSNEAEISSSLTNLTSEESLSKAQMQTIGDDEHVLLKEHQEGVVTKFSLSKNFNNAIQGPLLKLLSFLTIKGFHVIDFLLLWIQIYTGMFGQQVLSWNKGKVESKDLVIGHFLGQGCSGIFYETTWSRNSKVKLVRKDFPGVMGDTFVMEAIRLFELRDHPNIVKTFCWTIGNRSCSLIIEYIKDDLSSFMRKKKEALRKKGDQSMIGANSSPFQLLEAFDILLQIAIGMEYLHDKGIYHGDLKPNNILLHWKEGRILVKLVDFGLLETKRNSTLLSQRALCFRMIEWSAPELFEDFFSSMSEDLDFLWTTSLVGLNPSTSRALCFENGQKVILEKADSYSFGLISAYIFGCEQMWPIKLSPQELWKQISSYGLRPKLPIKCPPKLASLIYACWNIDPTCRPTFFDIRNKVQEIMKEQQKQMEELGIVLEHGIHSP